MSPSGPSRLFDGEVDLTALAFSWDCPRCKTPRKMPRSEALDGREFACVECKFPVTVKKVPSWRIYYNSEPANESKGETPPA
jgi:hypothetical protein